MSPPTRRPTTDAVTRRQVLALAASGTAGALAGCVGPGDGAEDAAWTDWLPDARDQVRTAYIDLAVSREVSTVDPLLPLVLPSDGDDDERAAYVPQLSALDEVDDPLLQLPLQTGVQIIAVSTLSLAFAGLGDLVDPATPDDGVTELFLANDTVVGTGTVDAEAAGEALRAGSAGAFGEVRFERVAEDGEYGVYEPVAGEEGVVAVSEDGVVVGDARQEVQQVLDATRGDAERAVESDGFGALFEAAGAGGGDVLVGWEAPVDFSEFAWGDSAVEPAGDLVSASDDDVVASVSFSPGSGEVAAGLALRSPALDDDDARARLRAELGAASGDSSVSFDGGVASASATYPTDVLDVDFVAQPTTTPEQTTAPGGDDLPPEVDAAVPDDAFEFVYRPEQGTVRVNFRESIEADSVTIRALEAESETSTSTPEGLTYLTVFVDTEGDVVVVEVTVDGVTGEVAREEIP
jgi:hypothetical protein